MILYPSSLSKREIPKNFDEKDRFLFEKEWEKTIPETFVKKLEKIMVNADFVLFDRKKIYEESFLNADYLKNPSFVQKSKFFIKNFIVRKHKKFDGSAIWLVDAWSSNYFHWLFDVLPRWWAAQKLSQKLPILLPQPFEKIDFVKQFLELLNIKAVFIPKNEVWHVQELYFISHTAPTGNYNNLIIRELNTFFSEKILEKKHHFGDRIYISRKNASKRKIVNEPELEILLANYGFQSLILEDYSVYEQLSMLKNVHFLVSIHGAGLGNMLFMPSGGRVFEIRRKGDKDNNAFFSLANALAFDYFYLLADSDSSDTHTANLTVDLVEMEEKLTYFLKK